MSAQAVIHFDDTLQGLWYMDINAGSNWLLALYRDADGLVSMDWRVLYHRPGSPAFDKDDHSSWHSVRQAEGQPPLTTLETAIETVRKWGRVMSQHAQGPLIELLRNGRSTADFWQEFIKQPFVNVKVEQLSKAGDA